MGSPLLRLVILASTLVVFGANAQTYRCPRSVPINKYVRTHGSSCYQFIKRERSWNSAMNDCRSRRGHLVTIRDRATQDFLFSSLREFHWPGNGVWIGASDQRNEMDWRWVTNHRVKDGYSNWARGQPSCHIFCFEDCAQMRLDEGGVWHDYKCNWVEDYSYICEYPLLPKTTTTTITTSTTSTTTTTTTTSPTTKSTTTTSTTTTPLVNSTVNGTGVMVKQLPDIKVEILGNSQRSKLEHSSESGTDTGSIIGLVLGLLCGLFLGLCIGVFFFRRRNKKDKEEEPTVFFSNPYYADVRAPLNPPRPPPVDYDDDDSCCAGGVSVSQASTPVKRPLNGPPIPQRAENVYHPSPTLAASSGSTTSAAGNYYDEITAQKLLYASGGSNQGARVEGAVGGVQEDRDLVDHHYDYTTGENFYESVDNVRLAIVQNELNEQQEERYVPFQFDSPEPSEKE